MAYQQKDGEGALWPVDPEKKKPNGPTATGTVTLDGVKYRVAAWRREGKDGKPAWLSLKVNPIDEDGGGARHNARTVDDEIPF